MPRSASAARAELRSTVLCPVVRTSATLAARARVARLESPGAITIGRGSPPWNSRPAQSRSKDFVTTTMGGSGRWPRPSRICCTSTGSRAGP